MGEGYVNPFLIGCDPEFLVLNKDKKHYAPINIMDKVGHFDPIGWDHNGRVGELHPTPSFGSYTLVKRLKRLILQAVNLFPDMQLRAGAFYKPRVDYQETLGGHVHLDIPFPRDGVRNPVVLSLARVTDFLEHLDVLPRIECNNRRIHSEYGQHFDIRRANNADRLEYRAMASWLYSPITAMLCLTCAKLAAVAPDTTQTLQNNFSEKKLHAWIESFKGADKDAVRITERIFDRGLKLQYDPTVNFPETWIRQGAAQ